MSLTNDQLAKLLHDLESDRVERKASLSDKGKIAQAICAFANDLPGDGQPGVVFIGVHDDGGCANAEISDEMLKTLAAMRDNGNILPFPILTVRKEVFDDCAVAVVIVEPALAPPTRYNGRVWIRVGPRRATATGAEEVRLSEKRKAQDSFFELNPVPNASIDELDELLFRQTYLPGAIHPDVLLENNRSFRQQLQSLRFLTPEAENIPTTLGILTLGYEPTRFIPCSYIQFIRIAGTEIGCPITDQAVVDGALPQLLRFLDEKLRANVSTALDFTSQEREVTTPDYPLEALQQISRNAVLHRTYESTNAPVRITWFTDRVEISGPGGLFGMINEANFGTLGLADYRNPLLAEVFKNMGYAQKFGYGIHVAKQALERNGNPPMEFTLSPTHVMVTIRRQA